MLNQSELEESLKMLKPAAEHSILKDLKMSSELEEHILKTIRLEDEVVQKPIRYKSYLWTIVAFAIALATTFTTFGFLHSSKTVRQTITTIETSMVAATPVAALATLLAKNKLRMDDFRLRPLPIPHGVS